MANRKKILNCNKVYKSLIDDFDLTIERLNRIKIGYIDGDDDKIKAIINFVLVENKMKFSSLPVVLKNTIIRYANDNFYDDEFTNKLINKKIIPYTYLPMEDDYMDIRVIEEACKNYDQSDYLGIKINSYNSSRYNIHDEKMYIKLLGKNYATCQTVEDVLRKMDELNLTRDTMSIFEMFALKLYAAKILNKNNIAINVDVYNVDREMEDGGCNDGKNIKLHINGANNKVIDMVNILNHEIVHCIQDKNVEENKISADNDIDLYIKDKILMDVLGLEYYSSNYFVTSFEFDAEFKARMMTSKMFNLVKINYDHSGKLKIFRNNASRMVNYVDKKVQKEGFRYDINRTYNSLNKIFEKVMDDLRKENPIKYKQILKKYELIRYEYNSSTNSFRRKSVKEMIDDMDKCSSKSDKGIYYNLLKTRFDEDKEERDDVYEAIKDILKASKKTKYKGDTRVILNHLVKLSNRYSEYTDKYIGYFNRKGGNKR